MVAMPDQNSWIGRILERTPAAEPGALPEAAPETATKSEALLFYEHRPDLAAALKCPMARRGVPLRRGLRGGRAVATAVEETFGDASRCAKTLLVPASGGDL